MKLKRSLCQICERKTENYLYICNYCHSLLDKVVSRVDKEFKYVDEGYSVFYYNDILSKLIWNFKFGNKRHLAYLFSEQLIEKIFCEQLHLKTDCIISVPIHKKTLLKRGFNQVELLEDEILRVINLKSSKENLIKSTFTQEQARLAEQERKDNLKDVFKILKPSEIIGKRILLLDDMITTGSTMEECGKVLKDCGASEVVALSLATSAT